MEEIVNDGSISFIKNDDGYEIYMSEDNSSGIKVQGKTIQEVIENLKPYLEDALGNLE